MVTQGTHIGVGLYALADVARLTGANAETVRRWSSDIGIVPRHFSTEKLLTFEELMEIKFIQLFRDAGVSFQAIRKASQAAARKFHTPYPFTFKRFDTDGKTIFATLIREKPKNVLIEDLERGQYVLQSIMKPFFKKLDYGGDTDHVARFWPRHKRGRVVLDPLRKFGKPIDSKSGIATSAIFDAVKAGRGQTPIIVARWLGIPVAAVNAAVAFEKSLTA